MKGAEFLTAGALKSSGRGHRALFHSSFLCQVSRVTLHRLGGLAPLGRSGEASWRR